MKYLFIRGCADGLWLEVESNREIWDVRDDIKYSLEDFYKEFKENKIINKKISFQTYKKVPLCEDQNTYHVYSLVGAERNVLRNLIQGYKE